ncbi:hypothetical protein FKM82_009449 [Ascaphus truei]
MTVDWRIPAVVYSKRNLLLEALVMIKSSYLWSSLTRSIHQEPSLPTFKTNLKTHLLNEASQYTWTSGSCPTPSVAPTNQCGQALPSTALISSPAVYDHPPFPGPCSTSTTSLYLYVRGM